MRSSQSRSKDFNGHGHRPSRPTATASKPDNASLAHNNGNNDSVLVELPHGKKEGVQYEGQVPKSMEIAVSGGSSPLYDGLAGSRRFRLLRLHPASALASPTFVCRHDCT